MAKIRLTESQLRNLVTESVKTVISEISQDLKLRAARTAYDYGQTSRSDDFYTSLQNSFHDNGSANVTLDGNAKVPNISFVDRNGNEYTYWSNHDVITRGFNGERIEQPGRIRLQDRRDINVILKGIKMLNPNSKFLDKKDWIC